ncbi:hypothetical protein GALMADRAFT_214212 [Galerina marginata CBS 339.88]|uniref:Uncharacterized protein n=1 Tax=Galerina marginata (strain CBS 339.88) TaxID=685588 RepID=A0A067SIQ8_GALM3|nr:hypothetical protein GALMADRAFT_214212 [Galerina marginata CBS 339.88]
MAKEQPGTHRSQIPRIQLGVEFAVAARAHGMTVGAGAVDISTRHEGWIDADLDSVGRCLRREETGAAAAGSRSASDAGAASLLKLNKGTAFTLCNVRYPSRIQIGVIDPSSSDASSTSNVGGILDCIGCHWRSFNDTDVEFINYQQAPYQTSTFNIRCLAKAEVPAIVEAPSAANDHLNVDTTLVPFWPVSQSTGLQFDLTPWHIPGRHRQTKAPPALRSSIPSPCFRASVSAYPRDAEKNVPYTDGNGNGNEEYSPWRSSMLNPNPAATCQLSTYFLCLLSFKNDEDSSVSV